MRVKIDSTAVVPLGWMLTGMGAIITGTVTGVFWISTVNFRLQRIEEKLGIPIFKAASLTPIDVANASQRK